jgi:hypothetical protein
VSLGGESSSQHLAPLAGRHWTCKQRSLAAWPVSKQPTREAGSVLVLDD